MVRRKRHRVFCSGCANLFCVEGYERPMCVANAYYVSGPLRSQIDVRGLVSAERKNRHNDCKDRASVSLWAYRIKRWLLWRLNDGSEKRIRAGKLSNYPLSEEAPEEDYSLEDYVRDTEVTKRRVVEEDPSEVTDSEGESVYDDGGDSGPDDDYEPDERDDTGRG